MSKARCQAHRKSRKRPQDGGMFYGVIPAHLGHIYDMPHCCRVVFVHLRVFSLLTVGPRFLTSCQDLVGRPLLFPLICRSSAALVTCPDCLLATWTYHVSLRLLATCVMSWTLLASRIFSLLILSFNVFP